MISFIISIFVIACASAASTVNRNSCASTSLAVYNVTFTGLWSKDVFPKQYPLFRPPAQWTKVLGRTHSNCYNLWRFGANMTQGVRQFVEKGNSAILDKEENGAQRNYYGRSHDEGYNIFSVNETASAGLKEFIQTGVTREFDQETQGQTGILDIFTTAAVRHGVGQAKATFFVDGLRSKVSMIARIVPSPDWFVGVDSLEMCQNGEWQDRVSLDLDPMDGGTDQGYTFTSPNWEEKPQKPISMIGAHFPNHPANSFYYPDKDKLPTLAQLEFVKIRTYNWKDGVKPEAPSSDDPSVARTAKVAVQEIQNEEAEKEERVDEQTVARQPERQPTRERQTERKEEATTTVEATTTATSTVAMTTNSPRGNRNNRHRGGRRKERKGRRGRKNRRRPQQPKEVINAMNIADQMVDCQVSEWSEWSACSKTCGFGSKTRRRAIVRKPENYGHPCPLLTESNWCGSMRNCGWTHFRGLNSRFGNNRANRTSQARVFRFGQ